MKILAFGEVMMRLAPPIYKKIEQTETLDLSFTGTGLNILAGLAQNGYHTELLTALPENNVGKAARASVRKLGVGDTFIEMHGNHIGTYFLEIGYGSRPSEVTYLNRTRSAFSVYGISDAGLEASLENCDWLHICGIALSTSDCSRKLALKLAKRAHEKGVKICFDFNFRVSLNQENNHQILIESYREILKLADLVFGSKRDLVDLLGITGETTEEIYQKFMEKYQVERFAGTFRTFKDDKKYIQGFMVSNQCYMESKPMLVETLDRIGTGDAFAAGLLTGIFEEWQPEKMLDFAITCGQLAHTTYGDSPVLDKAFIISHMNEHVDVKR